jgi:hypothetical protein|tara:strand:- start:2108 stop:2533 length:426 start_codon:yes stop_codon:yes gene_type:complete
MGLAASMPPDYSYKLPVMSNDKPHIHALDGHLNSVVSNHPDGQFAQNTAPTANYSQRALWELFTQKYALGYTEDSRTGEIVVPREKGVTKQALDFQRSQRTGKLEAVIKPPEPTASGRTSFDSTSLALGAFAVYLVGTAVV